LHPGYQIVGNMFFQSGTFILGGTGASEFDVGQVGSLSQYAGFNVFQKTGDSVWTLMGTNAAYMPWTISGGTLVVNAEIPQSTIVVSDGGALAGIGAVGNTTINRGRMLAPGNASNPTGTLSVTGNLAFQPGALYSVQVTPSAASSANVSGSATL